VFLIGTYDKDGKANVMNAGWGGVCSSDPLSLMFAVRSERYTYDALMSRSDCTVSIPAADLVRESDFFGCVSGRNRDKFDATSLTPICGEKVNAPYIEECPIVIECVVTSTVAHGAHVIFIAKVVDVKVDERLMDEFGDVNTDVMEFLAYDSIALTYRPVPASCMRAFTMKKGF
jgi:flavin reductase (DIM6/NTAB) family NADH-FMN oxidoreductase RutF